jgi:DNA repair protein RecN (Recombination protein N)
MLGKLTVKNFALIENVTIDFKDGFTVITGETGSGKSILLGALRLILGERADYSVIRNEKEKTIVEAIFQFKDKKLARLFDVLDLDFDDETIIRREISSAGKSRAFINDTPVQLSILKQVAQELVYIHSQHHTLELKDEYFQRNILDVTGGVSVILSEYQQEFFRWKKLKKDFERLEKRKAESLLNQEFNSFQLDELSRLKLDEKDYTVIEQNVNRAEEFEDIQRGYQLIAETINSEGGVAEKLGQLKRSIIVKDQSLNELIERVNSALIELDDIAVTALDGNAELDVDPQNVAELISDMNAYNSALRKHAKQSQEELIALYNDLKQEVNHTSSIDDSIKNLQVEIEQLEKSLRIKASEISRKRKNSAQLTEKKVVELLFDLKMPSTSLEFVIEKLDELNEFGQDKVTLYFQPNKGMKKTKIEKSASGGELSRLMLVIQYILSSQQELPTLIFDEIDTGVSGEVATKIGAHLSKMGEQMQLIAITHLPQVASKGEFHIRVFKKEENNETKTFLKSLSKDERVEEIAKLMSGERVNQAALENAQNLLEE